MNTFYLIGTGPSVNDITEEEWDYLKDKHTLAFGSFPYSGIPTKFFMNYERQNISIEDSYKITGKWDHAIILDSMAQYGNTDTILLIPHRDIQFALDKGYRTIIPVTKGSALFLPSRQPWFLDEEKPPHRYKECRAHNFFEPLFRYRGSLSAAINSCLILGADEIRLIGIDLNCQHDFFALEPDKWIPNLKVRKAYKEVVFPRLEARLEAKYKIDSELNPEINHTTDVPYKKPDRWGDRALRGMSDVVQWVDSELQEEGKRIFVTTKKSKLYNKIGYKPIMG